MVDPLSLASISAVALKSGYQVPLHAGGEALKRWREHRGAAARPATQRSTSSFPYSRSTGSSAIRHCTSTRWRGWSPSCVSSAPR
jgi:hypothetical protein